jgi:cytosine/adenosine deaminase-related metal-dependent hydrolase
LLRGATLVEFEPALVERGDLRVDKGRIIARGTSLEPLPEDEVTDLTGRIVMPGLVSAHHHLHASFLRGLVRRQSGFALEQALLEQIEDALSLDDVRAAAAMGALEGLCAGTTTIFNLHASQSAVSGALSRISSGLGDLGLRGVLAYELSERLGALNREQALDECASFIDKAKGRFRGAIGLSSLSSASNETLAATRAFATKTSSLILINAAEDPREEKASLATFSTTPLERLLAAELIDERTVMAQNVHFSWPELSDILGRGSWLVHSARSNMQTQAGLATPAKFGVRATFGTDVMSLDVVAEAQMAALRARDSGAPIDILRFLANGHRLASQAFGFSFGPLRENAVADLVVLDYQPPTPLTSQSLASHLLHGMASHHVDSVMIDGMWRLWKRKPLSVNLADLARQSREAAASVWSKLELEASAA